MMRIFLILLSCVLLAACSGRGSGTSNIHDLSDGPDEFTVLPNKTLSDPASFADLPAPTPGGANLVDPTPERDLAAALGGRVSPNAGIPASDAALVAHVGRAGVDPTIRSDLAAALPSSRRGWFGITRQISRARQRGQTLDPYAELERFRAAGVKTPTAPPQ